MTDPFEAMHALSNELGNKAAASIIAKLPNGAESGPLAVATAMTTMEFAVMKILRHISPDKEAVLKKLELFKKHLDQMAELGEAGK